MPRLSVLMPVRDALPYLNRAIRSTIVALPVDAEIAVFDDRSNVENRRALDAWAEHPRVRVLRAEQVTGVASALNYLMYSTDSEYVARMDGDDVAMPWRFSIDKLEVSSLDATFAPIVSINERGLPCALSSQGRISSRALPWHLLLSNVLVHPTLLARRSAIESVGGYRQALAEDYDLWLRLAAAGSPMARSGKASLLYRRHPAQVTKLARWADGDPATSQSYLTLTRRLMGIESDVGLAISLGTRQVTAAEYDGFVLRLIQAARRDVEPGEIRTLERRANRIRGGL